MAGTYPTSKTDYRGLAVLYAQEYGVNPDIFTKQINQESGFNPNAVSPAGAIGIAQFMPGTAAGLGINPWNPVDSLRGAARHMRDLLDRFSGDYRLALAGYNAGAGAVEKYGGVPPYEETRRYVSAILGGAALAPVAGDGGKTHTSGPSEVSTLMIDTPAGRVELPNPFAGVAASLHNYAVRGVAIAGGGALVLVGLLLLTKTDPVKIAATAASKGAI